MQIWVVLILSHLVSAQRKRITLTADCHPEDRVGAMVWWICWLGLTAPEHPSSNSLFKRVGNPAGSLASPRLVLKVPQVELSCFPPAPPDLPYRLSASASLSRPHTGVADLAAEHEASRIQTSQGAPSRTSPRCLVANGSHLIHF